MQKRKPLIILLAFLCLLLVAAIINILLFGSLVPDENHPLVMFAQLAVTIVGGYYLNQARKKQ